jgi:hypothetical protein
MSALFCLVGRAKVADRIKYLFFLVPDETIIILAPLFNKKTTGERHADGMSGFVKDKHRECSDEIIKETVLGVPEIGIAFTRIIP